MSAWDMKRGGPMSLFRWRRRWYWCGCGCGRSFTAGAGWDGMHGPDTSRPTEEATP